MRWNCRPAYVDVAVLRWQAFTGQQAALEASDSTFRRGDHRPRGGGDMPGVRVRPTEETRRTVKAMAGVGVPHAQIAPYLRIDAKSLRKHYRDELDRGMIEANVKVAQTLFTLATVEQVRARCDLFPKSPRGLAGENRHDAPAASGLTGSRPHTLIRVRRWRAICWSSCPNAAKDPGMSEAVLVAFVPTEEQR